MNGKVSSNDSVVMIKSMQSLLANSYLLMLKTQNCHWNISGPSFYSHHIMLESHYKELFEAVDKIAEIIRSMGVKAFASLTKYAKLSMLKEGSEGMSADQMIEDLIESHEIIASFMLKEYKNIKHPVVSALFDERLEAHGKAVWMLKSHLEE
jgi:starvation-inducible DNA-binding protein